MKNEMMNLKVFKKCSKCKREWYSMEEYKYSTEQVTVTDYLGGLSLRNCDCGTTLAHDALEIHPELEKDIRKLWDTDPRYAFVNKYRESQTKKAA